MNMKTIRTSLAVMLFLAVVAAPAFGQAAGRILGEIVDPDGNGVGGAKITLTTPEITGFSDEFTTNKKGKFTAVVVDATRVYKLKIEADGYRTHEEDVKAKPGDIHRVEITLYPVGMKAPTDPEGTESAPPAGQQRGGLTDAQKVYNEGVVASQAQQWEAALAKFEEAVELDPELTEAHLGRARLYLRESRNEEALAAAEAALALDGGSIAALEIAFDVHTMMSNEEQAAQVLKQLEDAGAGELAPRYFNAGVGALNAGDRETAKAKFRQAIEQDPNLVDAHSALAVVQLQLEEFEGALASADRALELDPENARARRMRFQALRFLGRDEEARAAFSSLGGEDRREALNLTYNEALNLFQTGEAAKAKVLFEDILAVDPEFAKAHYMMGLSYVNSGENAKAKEHFTRFLELAPDDPEAPTAREMMQYLG
jgi:Tfp pilus assembly protein PilF